MVWLEEWRTISLSVCVYIHIYIYVYTCVCVCVCMCVHIDHQFSERIVWYRMVWPEDHISRDRNINLPVAKVTLQSCGGENITSKLIFTLTYKDMHMIGVYE